ncbi:MAG: hypothetical protein ACE5G8_14995 [Anaerolineae bacterium]
MTKRHPLWLKYLFGATALAAAAVYLHVTLTRRVVNFAPSLNGRFEITDFLYHLLVVKAFWQGDIPSIYRLDAQRAVMSQLFHSDIRSVMPVGVTPTTLLLWLPLVFLASASLSWANTGWLSLSVGALGLAWWKLGTFARSHRKEMLRPALLFPALFLFSFPMFSALALGQTSILACGLLILLLLEVTAARRAERSLRRWLVYGLVFVLSLKLPYLLIAVGLLFVFGYRRESVVSGLIVGGVVLLVGALFGPQLLTDYAGQLSVYSQVTIAEYYAPSIVLFTTNTFRSAFTPVIGPAAALVISQVVFVAGGAIILAISLAQRVFPARLPKWAARAGEHQLAIGLFAVFLLFMPYMGGYEDLLLALPPAIVIVAPRGRIWPPWKEAFLLAGLPLALNHNFFPSDKPLWLFWLVKGGVLWLMAGMASAPPGEQK